VPITSLMRCRSHQIRHGRCRWPPWGRAASPTQPSWRISNFYINTSRGQRIGAVLYPRRANAPFRYRIFSSKGIHRSIRHSLCIDHCIPWLLQDKCISRYCIFCPPGSRCMMLILCTDHCSPWCCRGRRTCRCCISVHWSIRRRNR
jgi:hypothetical protein